MLDTEDHRYAKEQAAALGISLAEYVRRLVRADRTEPEPRPVDRSEIVDLFRSAESDVATYKDEYLAEAIGGKLASNRRVEQQG